MATVPGTPNVGEAAKACAAAARFGIDEQARKVIEVYERLQAHSFGAVIG